MFSKWSRDFSQRLGVYKFMPVFFSLGAAIELFMIKVRVGNETFCKSGKSVCGPQWFSIIHSLFLIPVCLMAFCPDPRFCLIMLDLHTQYMC